MPSMPGILMSIGTTSGQRRRALSTASAPVPASPTAVSPMPASPTAVSPGPDRSAPQAHPL